MWSRLGQAGVLTVELSRKQGQGMGFLVYVLYTMSFTTASNSRARGNQSPVWAKQLEMLERSLADSCSSRCSLAERSGMRC